MLLFIIPFILLIIFAYNIDFRKVYYALKMPGPMPLPFLGNGWLFLNKNSAGELLNVFISLLIFINFFFAYFQENFELVGNLIRNYGNTVAVWLLSDFHVLLSNPSTLEVSRNPWTLNHWFIANFISE